MALAALLVSWTRADAGSLECASHTLSERDQRRLLKIAAATVGDYHKALHAPSACRNFSWASAWMETEHWLNAEGAEEWWLVSCRRAWHDWSCKRPYVLRSATMTLVIDGQPRTVNLSFDGYTSLADARDFSSHAWSIYQGVTAAPNACAPSAQDQDEQTKWTTARARYPLEPTVTELHMTISKLPSGTQIFLFGNSGLAFKFRRDPNDQSVLPVCWAELLLVT